MGQNGKLRDDNRQTNNALESPGNRQLETKIEHRERRDKVRNQSYVPTHKETLTQKLGGHSQLFILKAIYWVQRH